ncbi:phage holin family protein [Rubellimicrobium aerolatum]|uniref:Phage holin family protein n=1 Tax=Rubellimicrobium aerolatum TaxID=490979 RepID=A0ABW0SFR5_9RHOB|nr:phage holin family protein [Rubellimicrobium aerolatum]MBP1806420.1 apolipoprotein N-acyltransferase [Rubellimicrobium aerolatum]
MSFDADPRPTGSLLSDAINQLTRLVRGEVALAKAEVAQNIRNAGIGVGLLVGAAILALVALHVLAAALVAALAHWIGPGWAALLVGVVVLIVAVILALRGLNALKPENLAPSRTVRSVQADAQAIKENVGNGNHK